MVTKVIILIIYFFILFFIGIAASKKVSGLKDFYVGGKTLGYWFVAFSARVTGESGWLILGLTGMGALAGVSAYWVVLGEILGVGLSWFFMAKPFKKLTDEYDSITIPDYLESHFQTKTHTLRVIAATTLSVFVIIFVSSQIDITGKAFEALLGLNYFTGAIIGFVIVVVYIFFGGFVAVVWSDFFQGIMMFLGLTILPIVGYFYLGDAELWEGLRSIDPALLDIWGGDSDPWMNAATIFGFAMIGLGFLGAPHIYVRFIAVKDVREIDHGKWVAVLFTLITDTAAVTIGLIGRYLFTEAGQDPEAILGTAAENVLVVLVETVFPLVIVGIYTAIVLSAIMSTIDSLLIVASSAITRDFYQKIFHPEIEDQNLTFFSRIVTIIMSLLALGIALTVAIVTPDRTVFWFAIFGWSGIAATFCPMMILSLFWKKYNAIGAMVSMVSGFACVPLFKFVIQNLDEIGIYFEKMDVLFPSFVISMSMGIIATYLFPSK
ncbi:sodium/proline symporter [Portibacter marinus]|uniref:sodium/proline symporter n=1 Tax=Portibacter marinus TaxID=2898660 RepID=UPI001F343AD2|nr:sodium/proline symporter [Portibacter marinus]